MLSHYENCLSWQPAKTRVSGECTLLWHTAGPWLDLYTTSHYILPNYISWDTVLQVHLVVIRVCLYGDICLEVYMYIGIYYVLNVQVWMNTYFLLIYCPNWIYRNSAGHFIQKKFGLPGQDESITNKLIIIESQVPMYIFILSLFQVHL